MVVKTWKDSAAAVAWNIQPFINGKYVPSTSVEVFGNINPATGMCLCNIPVGSAIDVEKAVQVARNRFVRGGWSDLPPVRRAEILLKLADLIVRHQDEFALLDCLEMGKPISASLDDAGRLAPMLLRSWAGLADKLVGESAPLMGGAIAFNTYEPRGVIGAITPWNFPLVNAVYKFGPALVAGNSLVLKPSEISPSSALRLAEFALEAGLPEGVFNVVPGLGTTVGVALASHPDIDLLSFTGSTATARKIAELAGQSNAKPLILECGGKSPHVVFSDVEDLEAVANAAAQSLLRNQGQVCAAHTRLLVQQDIKDKLLDKTINHVSQYHLGDPLDETITFGPLASAAQRDRVGTYIEQGLAEGAVAVLKGKVQEEDGYYVTPTIFDSVNSAMSIAREEIFGPVLCVQTFTTEEEAVALANASEYGLTATVWTRNMGCGRRLARSIRAGSISVRTSGQEDVDSGCVLSREPQKASGFGSELGISGLRAYSTLKYVSFSGA